MEEAGERTREERAEEEPADLRSRLAREDEARAQTDRPHRRIVGLEPVEESFDLGLVAAVEAARDAVRRPGLVDAPVLRPARVGADGRCVDEVRHAGASDGVEDAPAAGDVRQREPVEVV